MRFVGELFTDPSVSKDVKIIRRRLIYHLFFDSSPLKKGAHSTFGSSLMACDFVQSGYGFIWTLRKGYDIMVMVMQMKRFNNLSLLPLARKNRNNMTFYERKLWYDYLRKQPVKFRRQKIIGPYIVDFYAASIKLGIEIDGDYHCLPDKTKADNLRTAYLQKLGLEVVRISNEDIDRDFSAVCKKLEQIIYDKA